MAYEYEQTRVDAEQQTRDIERWAWLVESETGNQELASWVKQLLEDKTNAEMLTTAGMLKAMREVSKNPTISYKLLETKLNRDPLTPLFDYLHSDRVPFPKPPEKELVDKTEPFIRPTASEIIEDPKPTSLQDSTGNSDEPIYEKTEPWQKFDTNGQIADPAIDRTEPWTRPVKPGVENNSNQDLPDWLTDLTLPTDTKPGTPSTNGNIPALFGNRNNGTETTPNGVGDSNTPNGNPSDTDLSYTLFNGDPNRRLPKYSPTEVATNGRKADTNSTALPDWLAADTDEKLPDDTDGVSAGSDTVPDNLRIDSEDELPPADVDTTGNISDVLPDKLSDYLNEGGQKVTGETAPVLPDWLITDNEQEQPEIDTAASNTIEDLNGAEPWEENEDTVIPENVRQDMIDAGATDATLAAVEKVVRVAVENKDTQLGAVQSGVREVYAHQPKVATIMLALILSLCGTMLANQITAMTRGEKPTDFTPKPEPTLTNGNDSSNERPAWLANPAEQFARPQPGFDTKAIGSVDEPELTQFGPPEPPTLATIESNQGIDPNQDEGIQAIPVDTSNVTTETDTDTNTIADANPADNMEANAGEARSIDADEEPLQKQQRFNELATIEALPKDGTVSGEIDAMLTYYSENFEPLSKDVKDALLTLLTVDVMLDQELTAEQLNRLPVGTGPITLADLKTVEALSVNLQTQIETGSWEDKDVRNARTYLNDFVAGKVTDTNEADQKLNDALRLGGPVPQVTENAEVNPTEDVADTTQPAQ